MLLPTDPAFRYRPQLFETLGRVLLTLKKIHCLDGMPNLDWWITIDGQLCLEWVEGALPAEIADQLARSCHDDEIEELRDISVAGRWSFYEHVGQISLWFNDVRLDLRAHEPIGLKSAQAAALQRAFDRRKEILA